tara:strand:- start:773 stop:1645 length:873 start_codon:yes stop_codon:yes gene_type:complete
MDFIKEIHEARLTRGNGARSLTYTDCCERAYLTMLVLEVLRKFPGTTPIVQQYARNTSGYDSYKHFRLSGTDLYNFVYFIVGDEDAHKKLKDPGAARRMRERTQFPLMNFNRYVERLRYNRAPTADDQNLFIRLEGVLRITNSDYKIVRRNLFSFQRISTRERQSTITRLLLAARAKLRTSDVIGYIEELSALKDLEIFKVTDPEPKVSVPDVDVTGKDLGGYRYLVGAKNLLLTKKFLELAKDNKSIPANVVQAYIPAIATIDNIVKAGPGFVQMLRTLENRAKKHPKS